MTAELAVETDESTLDCISSIEKVLPGELGKHARSLADKAATKSGVPPVASESGLAVW